MVEEEKRYETKTIEDGTTLTRTERGFTGGAESAREMTRGRYADMMRREKEMALRGEGTLPSTEALLDPEAAARDASITEHVEGSSTVDLTELYADDPRVRQNYQENCRRYEAWRADVPGPHAKVGQKWAIINWSNVRGSPRTDTPGLRVLAFCEDKHDKKYKLAKLLKWMEENNLHHQLEVVPVNARPRVIPADNDDRDPWGEIDHAAELFRLWAWERAVADADFKERRERRTQGSVHMNVASNNKLARAVESKKTRDYVEARTKVAKTVPSIIKRTPMLKDMCPALRDDYTRHILVTFFLDAIAHKEGPPDVVPRRTAFTIWGGFRSPKAARQHYEAVAQSKFMPALPPALPHETGVWMMPEPSDASERERVHYNTENDEIMNAAGRQRRKVDGMKRWMAEVGIDAESIKPTKVEDTAKSAATEEDPGDEGLPAGEEEEKDEDVVDMPPLETFDMATVMKAIFQSVKAGEFKIKMNSYQLAKLERDFELIGLTPEERKELDSYEWQDASKPIIFGPSGAPLTDAATDEVMRDGLPPPASAAGGGGGGSVPPSEAPAVAPVGA